MQLGKLTGSPYLLGAAGVVFAGLLVTIGALKWQIVALEADVAQARQATAEVRVELEACRADARGLEAAVERQNALVRRLAEERDAASALAATRSVRVLVRERERALPEGHGPDVMNQWFSEALE